MSYKNRFRVRNKVGNRIEEETENLSWVLNTDGELCRVTWDSDLWEEEVEALSGAEAKNYVAEFATGLLDRNDEPIFEKDEVLITRGGVVNKAIVDCSRGLRFIYTDDTPSVGCLEYDLFEDGEKDENIEIVK